MGPLLVIIAIIIIIVINTNIIIDVIIAYIKVVFDAHLDSLGGTPAWPNLLKAWHNVISPEYHHIEMMLMVLLSSY